MHGQNRAIYYQDFVYPNLTSYSTDRSTNKKYLCESSFEMYFLREQFLIITLGNWLK